MNKNERAKAVDRIVEALKKENIETTPKQTQEKLRRDVKKKVQKWVEVVQILFTRLRGGSMQPSIFSKII